MPILRSVKKCSQFIAPQRAHHVLMVDVMRFGQRGQQRNGRLRIDRLCASACTSPGAGEQAVVAAGEHAPLLVPVVEMLQLHPQHGRLHRIQPAVPSNLLVVIALSASVIPQTAHVVRDLLVIGGDASAIAVSAEVFRGIKAECRGLAQRPGFLAVSTVAPNACAASSTMATSWCLASLPKRIHVGALAVQMNWHDGANCFRLRRASTAFSTVTGSRFRVAGSTSASSGVGPATHDRTDRGEEAEGVVTTLVSASTPGTAYASHRASVPDAQPMLAAHAKIVRRFALEAHPAPARR